MISKAYEHKVCIIEFDSTWPFVSMLIIYDTNPKNMVFWVLSYRINTGKMLKDSDQHHTTNGMLHYMLGLRAKKRLGLLAHLHNLKNCRIKLTSAIKHVYMMFFNCVIDYVLSFVWVIWCGFALTFHICSVSH